MKVADVYTLLGLKVDHGAYRRGDAQIEKTAARARKASRGIGQAMAAIHRHVAGLAGGLALGAAVKGSYNFSEALTDLVVASQGAVGSNDELEDRILRVSNAHGVAKERVLAMAQAFVEETGDGKAAIGMLDTFARSLVATKTEAGALSKVMASSFKNLEIGTGDMEKAMSVLHAGGKFGAVELKNMASELPSVAAKFAQFSGGKGLKGLATLGALLQTAKIGFGTSGETATGFESAMAALQKRADKFADAGVKIYGPKGQLRNLLTIFTELKAKGLSGTKLSKLFGREEGKHFFNMAMKPAGAVEKLRDETLKSNAIQDDYVERQSKATAKLRIFWVRLKNQIHVVTREIIILGGKLVDAFQRGGQAVSAFKGLLVGLAIVAGVAAARVAASWLLAMAPLVLLGAGVAALIALFESLTGRDFFEDLRTGFEWLLRKTRKGIELLADLRRGLGMDDAPKGKIIDQKLAKGIDPRTGRPIADPKERRRMMQLARAGLGEKTKVPLSELNVPGFVGWNPVAESIGRGMKGDQQYFPAARTLYEAKKAEFLNLRRPFELQGPGVHNEFHITVEGDGDEEKIRAGVNRALDEKLAGVNN